MTNIEAIFLVNPPLIFTLGFVLQSLMAKRQFSKGYIFGITLLAGLWLLIVIEGIGFTPALIGFAVLYGLLALAAAHLYTILKKILRIYYMSRYK